MYVCWWKVFFFQAREKEVSKPLEEIQSETRKVYDHHNRWYGSSKDYSSNKNDSKISIWPWKLRTHVTGVLVHTKSPHGKLAYAFVDLLEYPHHSNLTITLILKVLVQFTEVMKMLPENLYIQMDNTSRENKNRYVLAFCALPVQLKIFKKVRLWTLRNKTRVINYLV